MAMGSDTGGSIRMPAAFCGVTGLKPTHGAISMRGVMPMTPSLDTAGPLAVSAADCALVHGVLSGFDPDDPYSREGRPLDPPEGLRGVRIALPRPWFRMLHPETTAAVEGAAHAFEDAGAHLDETDSPDIDGVREYFVPLAFAEVAHHYRDLWDDERVSPQIKALIDLGRSVTGAALVAARERALRLRRDFEWALTSADAVLAPCVPFPAPKIGQAEVEVEGGTIDVDAGGPTRFTLPVNLAGLPSVAFPVGFSGDGLPLGAQLIGRDWSELFLCAVVDTYQQATDWHLRRAEAWLNA
jgi:aspartyl-tRNA(Asn)/glutamyl-tRNA(Gln) amidotransferase subunit A